MSEQPGAQFSLQRIYVKDLSFESPQAPNGFRTQWKPKVSMDLNSRHSQFDDGLYEVILQITITVKNDEDATMYLVEIQQAGIFRIEGVAGEELAHTLGAYCPDILFPYARESIDGMVIRGSFPPLMVAPVNFEAIYQQARAQREAQESQIN